MVPPGIPSDLRVVLKLLLVVVLDLTVGAPPVVLLYDDGGRTSYKCFRLGLDTAALVTARTVHGVVRIQQ